MAAVQTSQIRNVALLSHSGAGKTTLCEACLFFTKVTTRMGRVEDGNTVSDYEPEEVKRRASVQLKTIPFQWNSTKINLLDTPGYDDFLSEVIASLRVVEGAAIVVSAVSGVEVGTERVWQLCEQRNLPRIIVINKLDRENADFLRTLQQIHNAFGRRCVAFQLPIGSQQYFKGMVDLLKPPEQLPAGTLGDVESFRDRLMEAVAETDDDLTTKYLEKGELSQEELVSGIKRGVKEGKLVPVFGCAASSTLGIQGLLAAISEYLPSPAEVGTVKAQNPGGSQEAQVEPNPAGPLAALVFKTTADPFVGKLSFFRVYRGSIRSNSEVWNASKGQSERIGQLYLVRGKTQEPVTEVVAGHIGAVAKLANTSTNDTLCQRDQQLLFEPISFPKGSYAMAVLPKSKADLDKMSTALSRITEEDPSVQVRRDHDTSETLLSGLGDNHLEVALEKMKRKFGAELVLHLPKVAYKETITTTTQAEYRHKKQTGGHGQYGHVVLRLEPQERGKGFEFSEELFGGSVPKEYIPSVQKGVTKALQEGVIVGYPVVDLKVVLYDGSYHEVDSSGMSFEIAGYYGVKKGVTQANPALLEPIMKLSVTVPESYTGDIIGDLNGKRGRILGMTQVGSGQTMIDAEAPLAELLRYATVLRSLTQGRGTYTMEFLRYEDVPFNITQKIIEESKKAKEAAEKG